MDIQRYSTHYKASHDKQLTYDDLLFCKWIDTVEDIVLENTRFHLLELEDEMYMVNFENKMSADEMAHMVIVHFKEFCDFIS
jgi:hypothetical protein